MILALQKLNPSEIVQRHPVVRILSQNFYQMLRRAIVIAFLAQNSSVEEMRASQLGAKGQSFFEDGAGAGDVALL